MTKPLAPAPAGSLLAGGALAEPVTNWRISILCGEAQEFVERDHSNWESIIEMRRATMADRRG